MQRMNAGRGCHSHVPSNASSLFRGFSLLGASILLVGVGVGGRALGVEAWAHPSLLVHVHVPVSHHITTTISTATATATTSRRVQVQLQRHMSALKEENDSLSSLVDLPHEVAGILEPEPITFTTNNENVMVEAFHGDMLRVLESRRVPSSSSSSSFSNRDPDESSRNSMSRRGTSRHNSNNNSKNSNNNNNSRRPPPILGTDADGAERCLCMLQHLKDTLHAANEQSYQIVMQAFLERGRTRWRDPKNGGQLMCAADQLELLLRDLEAQRDMTIIITTPTYNLVLAAYAECATPHAHHFAARAQELVQRMPFPTVESHLHVLHAYAWQQANRQAGTDARQAEDILMRHILTATTTTTTTGTYDMEIAAVQMQACAYVLEAWSKSLKGAPRCMELLQQMKQFNATHPHPAVAQILDPEVYSNAILAWSKETAATSGASGVPSASSTQSAEQAHALLLELLDQLEQGSFGPTAVPPLIAFNSVITAWGRARRPDQVEYVLQLLERARQRHPDRVQPDAVLYNSILHSLLSGPLPTDVALQKSLQLLQYMREESLSGRQPAIAPDAYSYYTLLKCWIQSGSHVNSSNNNNKNKKKNNRQQHHLSQDTDDATPHAAEQAEALLHLIEECWKVKDTSVKPSRLIYNMVMNAYSKSQHRQAAPRAIDLLQRMKESAFPDCHPDIISYTSVLECLSKPNCCVPNPAQMAQQLLDEAGERCRAMPMRKDGVDDAQQQQEQEQFMPNLRTYTMAIQTLANHGGSVQQARAWLTQLCDDYRRTQLPSLKPNTYPYNYVLNCAANTQGTAAVQLQAFQMAAQTFQEMRHSHNNNTSTSSSSTSTIQPDSFSYAFWFKCCRNLLPPNSDLQRQCVQLAWNECQQRGLATDHVVQRYQQIMGLGRNNNDDDDETTATPTSPATAKPPPPMLSLSRRAAALQQNGTSSSFTANPPTSRKNRALKPPLRRPDMPLE